MEEVTNEELARIINKGFNGVQEQFNEMGKKFDGMQGQINGINGKLEKMHDKLEYVDARLGRLENDVKEMRGEIIYRHEFEDALSRIKLIERKMGIESGK